MRTTLSSSVSPTSMERMGRVYCQYSCEMTCASLLHAVRRHAKS